MNNSLTGLSMRACALALAVFVGRSTVAAPVVWTGPTITFAKEAFADFTQPENQDHLTDGVILVRGDSEGMFNYALEPKYDRDFHTSPLGTKWATSFNNPGDTISATNYAALEFVDWAFAYNGPGSPLIGNITTRNAVVWLVGAENTVDDDIYLDLMFTEFSGGGAPYSYNRSTPAAVIVPTGDYNGDTFVNAADYTVWRNTLRQSVAMDGDGADGDGDGVVDFDDYLFWKNHYGDMVGGVGVGQIMIGSVPEPTAITLAAASILVVSCASARRPRRSRQSG